MWNLFLMLPNVFVSVRPEPLFYKIHMCELENDCIFVNYRVAVRPSISRISGQESLQENENIYKISQRENMDYAWFQFHGY